MLIYGLQDSDGCYAWWVAASLAILGGLDKLDCAALRRFVVSLQSRHGGLSAHPQGSPVKMGVEHEA